MEKIQYEYVAYVFNKTLSKYVQLGITLSPTYEICKRVYDDFCKEYKGDRIEYDLKDYHIKFRKIVYSQWEVIYE